jgi:hypothetical protein
VTVWATCATNTFDTCSCLDPFHNFTPTCFAPAVPVGCMNLAHFYRSTDSDLAEWNLVFCNACTIAFDEERRGRVCPGAHRQFTSFAVGRTHCHPVDAHTAGSKTLHQRLELWNR